MEELTTNKSKLLMPKCAIRYKEKIFILMEDIQPFKTHKEAKEKKFELTDVNRNVKVKIVEQNNMFYIYKLK